jgi:signal transduction histidine kinase
VRSNPGKGTVVAIALPLKRATAVS